MLASLMLPTVSTTNFAAASGLRPRELTQNDQPPSAVRTSVAPVEGGGIGNTP